MKVPVFLCFFRIPFSHKSFFTSLLGNIADKYPYINPKHRNAPPGALAALLAHEALHQDEYNSLSEAGRAFRGQNRIQISLFTLSILL